MMVEIEKNIPIPPGGGGKQVRYPWKQLEIGDSFFVDGAKATSLYRTGVAVFKGTGRRIRVRAENGGARVWRTE